MPDLVGATLQDAQDAIQALTDFGIPITTSGDATGEDRNQINDRNWTVCSQNVAAGETITLGTAIDFAVVQLDESCWSRPRSARPSPGPHRRLIAPPPPGRTLRDMTARITFLGDTLLGSKAQPTLDREGHAHALSGLAPLLADADLVIANHEGPVTVDAPPAEKSARRPAWRRADPASLVALRHAGVRLVGLGNNHVLDHGPQGLADTLAALDTAGIAHCGAGPDAASAAAPAVLDVAGERLVVVAGLGNRPGYCATPDRPGPADLGGYLLAGLPDGLRIVLPHWGPGYGPVDDAQRGAAAVLRAAGADLVVGTHPHSAQPVDLDGAPVLWGLGNGAYGSFGRFARHGAPPYGLVATVEVDGGAVTALELRPILTDNKVVHFRPRPADDRPARAFLRSVVDPAWDWSRVDGGLRWERVRAAAR